MPLWNVSSTSGILIVATGKHIHFVWLAFDTDQRFLIFDFLILKSIFEFQNFSNFQSIINFEFVSSSLKFIIVSMVRHVLYGDLSLIENKEY